MDTIQTAKATAAAPTYNEGHYFPLSSDLSGNLRVNASVTATVTPAVSSTSSVPLEQTIGAVTAVAVLALNATRKGCAVQNCGTTVLYIGLGQTPTSSNYHIALAAGGQSNDGSSNRWDGTISGCLWQGAVNVISSGSGGLCNVVELT